MVNFKKIMMASAGGGVSAYMLSSCMFNAQYTQYFDVQNSQSNLNTAYKSNGNLVALWGINVGGNQSSGQLQVSEFDPDGNVVQSRRFSGYIQPSTRYIASLENGFAICVDANDNVFIASGATGSSVFVARMEPNFSNGFTWINQSRSYAESVCGIGVNPFTNNLWMKQPDGNNIIVEFNGATGAQLGQRKYSYSSPGMQFQKDRCQAYWWGYTNRIATLGRTGGSGYRPMVCVESVNTLAAVEFPLNNYTSSSSASWNYPHGVATKWRVGNTDNTTRELVVTGRIDDPTKGTGLHYVSSLDGGGSQIANGYFSNTYPNLWNNTSAPARDADENSYFAIAKYVLAVDKYSIVIVKLSRTFTVLQAIGFTPTTTALLNFNGSPNVACVLNQDETAISVPIRATGTSGQKCFTYVNVPTDLTSISTGTYSFPLQLNNFANTEFTVTDETAAATANFFIDNTIASQNMSVSPISIGALAGPTSSAISNAAPYTAANVTTI